MIATTRNLESLRPQHASERFEAYRQRLADALARGEIDPADVQFREVRGAFQMEALRAYWGGRQ